MKAKSDFVLSGVLKEKILDVSTVPCFVWNVDEKRILNGMEETHGVFEKEGRRVFDIKPGNRMVTDKSYTQLDKTVVDSINQSDGIIVVETSYSDNFRFAFVPN